MKCIKRGIEYRRVTEMDAVLLVAQGWQYCSKSEYRAKVTESPVLSGELAEQVAHG